MSGADDVVSPASQLQGLINAPAQLPHILNEIGRGWRMGARAR